MTGGKPLVSIRFLDQFKLYEIVIFHFPLKIFWIRTMDAHCENQDDYIDKSNVLY